MTNFISATIKSKLFITAAYKYVALAVMLTNCNLFVQKTCLPLDHPIAQTDITLSRCAVNPPLLMGFGGSLVTDKCLFGFGHGHLSNYWEWEFHPESSTKFQAQREEWAKMPSQIGTNDAHQLALNWLAGLGVDTATLEKEYPWEIKQECFFRHNGGGVVPLDQVRVPLPIFVVSWGAIPIRGHPQYSFPVVTMAIFGPTRELIEYHLLDDSLMLRPKLEINNVEDLLAITDAEFHQLDDQHKRRLIEQFGF